MKISTTLILLLLSCCKIMAQALEEHTVISALTLIESVPEKLLSSRSVVIYPADFTDKELEEIQKAFQQTGIDAVAYFRSEYVFAGPDFIKSYTDHFNSRLIRFLVFVSKPGNSYQIIFTAYNGTRSFIDKGQSAWLVKDQVLPSLLRAVFQTAISSQKKSNFLINEIPEKDVPVKYFTGDRREVYTTDVKARKAAIPKWGDEKRDEELISFLKNNFPVKYELVDPALTDAELRDKGFATVLRFVHTRGDLAKQLLNYDVSQLSSALTTVTYENQLPKIKTIPAETVVYKFYFKNLDYGTIFLGTKWDADITWQEALRNHIDGLKVELKIN